jgi:hypothetical protein
MLNAILNGAGVHREFIASGLGSSLRVIRAMLPCGGVN